VKASLHDGLTLPRAYRRAGFRTDLCDATNLATCRMYRSGREVWFGLAKNAREGMAATGQIVFWTVVLVCGQMVPYLLLVFCWYDPDVLRLALLSIIGSVAVRAGMSARFHQSLLGELLHPLALLFLLMLQWYAIVLAVAGKPVGWKGRVRPTRA
jgi:hypothetical protein